MISNDVDTYEFLIEIIALGVHVVLEVVILISLLLLIQQSLILLARLKLSDLWSQLCELCLSIDLLSLLGDLEHADGSAHREFVEVDLVLHLDHFEVAGEGELADGIEVEIELILVDLIEVTLDVVEVLEGESQMALAKVRLAALNFVPHALHIMNVQCLMVI